MRSFNLYEFVDHLANLFVMGYDYENYLTLFAVADDFAQNQLFCSDNQCVRRLVKNQHLRGTSVQRSCDY